MSRSGHRFSPLGPRGESEVRGGRHSVGGSTEHGQTDLLTSITVVESTEVHFIGSLGDVESQLVPLFINYCLLSEGHI